VARVQITPELTQKVKQVIDILDIARELTVPRRQGRKYVALCPFHKEKSPSFQIDPELGLFHCFGCGAGGDAIALHMRASGDDFPAAIEALARRYRIPIPEIAERPGAGLHRQRDPAAALEAAQAYFRTQLARNDLPRAYLAKRQIPPALQERFGLGFAPDGWQNLLDALRGQVAIEDLEAVGLVGRSESGQLYDRFRLRLMFPIHSPSGRIVGFGGRTLGDDRAKYVNTAETAFFKKGELLFGLYQAKRAIREAGQAVLVEGYFDVLAMAAAGVETAVAGMGTALTPEQAQLLTRFGDEVVLAYDGDEAGQAAAQRSLPILLATGIGTRRAFFPAGHDPDSLRVAQGPEAVKAALAAAEDAVWLEIEHLSPPGIQRDPRSQSRAVKTVLDLLKPLRDRVVRDAYSRRAAQRLGVAEAVLLRRDGIELHERSIQSGHGIRTEEEKALGLLFGTAPLPPSDELPIADIFLDQDCRNIFEVFCVLYKQDGRRPERKRVIEELSQNGLSLDRAARFLLQDSVPEGEGDLLDTLGKLRTRWLKRRQTEIKDEIRQAEQRGDSSRLSELLDEKFKLNRLLHPAMHGRFWS
jgi:DNA primase